MITAWRAYQEHESLAAYLRRMAKTIQPDYDMLIAHHLNVLPTVMREFTVVVNEGAFAMLALGDALERFVACGWEEDDDAVH